MSEKYKHYFETRFSFDERREKVWRHIARFIQRYIPADSRILEVGAGYCNFINNIKALERHALDNSQVSAQYIKGDVTFHLGSITKMEGIKSSYFDIIFASNILEHLSFDELKAAFLEIKRALKSGGRIFILQPNFTYSYKVYFDDYAHKQIFTHKSLSNFLEENGFRIKRVLARFLPFSMKSKFPVNDFLVWLYLRLPFKPFAGQMFIIAEKLSV